MAESGLQAKINKDLRNLGIEHYHKEKGRGGYRQKYQHNGGKPDLFIWPGDGVTVFIELKYGKGKMSYEQIEFIQKMTSRGYRCYEVRNWFEWEQVKKQEGWE